MRDHEIAISPLEERSTRPRKRGDPSDDVISGAKVLPGLITADAPQTPYGEMDITKVQALRAGRRLAEAESIPNHITSGEATRTILRALRFALTIEPTAQALEIERKFIARYPKVIQIPKIIEHTNGRPKFMTLADIHTAASRELVLSH